MTPDDLTNETYDLLEAAVALDIIDATELACMFVAHGIGTNEASMPALAEEIAMAAQWAKRMNTNRSNAKKWLSMHEAWKASSNATVEPHACGHP